MPKYNILRALEFDKLSAATKKKYVSAQGLVDAGWWTQKKYDGVFGKFDLLGGTGLSCMYTRTGEVISSVDHIQEQLLLTLPEPFKAAGCVILGELWAPGLPFPTISGDVRRHASSPHLKFVINDILPGTMVTGAPYRERWEKCTTLWPDDLAPSIMVAETFHDRLAVDFVASSWAAQGGFDGAILRDPGAPYTIGDAKLGQIVKVKPTLSLALRVDEIFIGEGKKTKRPVYTVKVFYRGVSTIVGAGMPHASWDCPAVGQIIEVECLGITADGALREPRYKGIRHDVKGPDA